MNLVLDISKPLKLKVEGSISPGYAGDTEITMTPQEKAKDKRLWKTYRWTLALYNALGDLQEWKCAGCGRMFKDRQANLDHEHFKIDAHRIISDYPDPGVKWEALVIFSDGRIHRGWGPTKAKAIEKVRESALPASVRGLLCPGRHGKAGHGCCNRLLGRVDCIWWLEAMVRYLKDPPARKIQVLTGKAIQAEKQA